MKACPRLCPLTPCLEWSSELWNTYASCCSKSWGFPSHWKWGGVIETKSSGNGSSQSCSCVHETSQSICPFPKLNLPSAHPSQHPAFPLCKGKIKGLKIWLGTCCDRLRTPKVQPCVFTIYQGTKNVVMASVLANSSHYWSEPAVKILIGISSRVIDCLLLIFKV